MNTLNYINDKIDRAKALDFGTIFGNSIELFKKTWLQGFLMQLFILILALPFLIIFYIPLVIMIFSEGQKGHYDPDLYNTFFAGFSILFIIFFAVGILALTAVSICLNAAFYRIMKKLDEDKEVKTNDFFIFLKAKYLYKAVLLMLFSIILSVVIILLIVPTFFMSFFAYLYFMVPLYLFTVFFAFNPEMNVSDIIMASFKLGNKKWLLLFGLLFVSSISASIVGLLLCGIGSLFTAAFVYHPVYLVYKEIVGFDDVVESESMVNFNE